MGSSLHRLYVALSIGAVALLGLMSGFFFAFAVDVAPAMTHPEASSYITTQQWINRVVRHALFGGVYFGSVSLPFAVALVAYVGRHARVAVAWAAIAATYSIAVFWVTRSINVPINEALALWNPGSPPPEWAQARGTWNQGNVLRAWGSFVCFLSSLVVLARRSYP